MQFGRSWKLGIGALAVVALGGVGLATFSSAAASRPTITVYKTPT